MANDSGTFIRIGIECESIEGDTYGVARSITKLLTELASRPELASTHRFVLYFNRTVPDLPLLKSPVFEARLVGLPRWGLPSSFSLYYYVLLPLSLWMRRVDAMYYPNYMLPIIHPPHVPTLVMMTEDIFREARNPKLPFRYRLAYQIFSLGWARRFATRIMAISRSSRDTLAGEGIDPRRIAVNELAVDPPRHPSSLLTARNSILWVGQAFERRHLREALAAFAELAQGKPHLLFRIIGPDKYEPQIIANTVRHINAQLERPAIVWDQQVSDEALADAYAQARALVYVSDTEAFGLPPLEALSYGVLPIVADVPVTREIYGAHAFYVSEPTPHAIGTALRAALSYGDKGEAIKRAAPGILKRYTWQAHADRFLGIMSELTA